MIAVLSCITILSITGDPAGKQYLFFLAARTPRGRLLRNGQKSITDMFSPAPKKKTEEKELKENGVEEDEDSVEPDEKKPKLDIDDEPKESTKDSEQK